MKDCARGSRRGICSGIFELLAGVLLLIEDRGLSTVSDCPHDNTQELQYSL